MRTVHHLMDSPSPRSGLLDPSTGLAALAPNTVAAPKSAGKPSASERLNWLANPPTSAGPTKEPKIGKRRDACRRGRRLLARKGCYLRLQAEVAGDSHEPDPAASGSRSMSMPDNATEEALLDDVSYVRARTETPRCDGGQRRAVAV